MTKLPEGKTRLDLVREGLGNAVYSKPEGRLIVSIAKLVEDSLNERRTFRNMEGLIASVKAVGVVEPITVTPDGGGTYRIITGHRRYRAAVAAGLEKVEVLIREPEDEPTRRRKSIISNVQREDVGPVELAQGLQSLMKDDEQIKSQDDLALVIGKDKSWVSGMLRILTLPSDLRQKVERTQRSIPYESMISIARLDDETQQRPLIDALLNGATKRDIRQQIDAIKGKTSKAKSTSTPKPKRAFRTHHRAIVIIQAMSSHLTDDQCVAALKEALGIATAAQDDG